MKLLFLILAHDRPEAALQLARTLTGAAQDALALIHFDARADPADFGALQEGARGEPRIRLARRRVACRWGGFGLVEAPLEMLAQAEAEGIAFDYAVLLSGACLPCRPVAQLERFLEENAGREFIEAGDESWVLDGLREERHSLYHLVDTRRWPRLERALVQLQRALRVRRRLPRGLTPRFGSQWWALSGATCRAILRDLRRRPRRLRFFRSVWIPDETAFQTWVHALAADRVAGFGLTHYRFTNRGKPVVFHDDHLDYALGLDRFFLRKVSPSARGLRAALLARAAEADDGAVLPRRPALRPDYEIRARAQTHYPRPGHIFFRDQLSDQRESVLARAEGPYAVLFGPERLTRPIARALAARLAPGTAQVLGEVFAPGRVDLGPASETLGGLSEGDAAPRDQHPALWLTRLRARCAGLPVLTWSPLSHPRLLEAVLDDPKAMPLACLPLDDDMERERRLLRILSTPADPPPPAAGAEPEAARRRAWLETLAEAPAADGGEPLDWLGWRLFHHTPRDEALRRRTIPLTWAARRAGPGGCPADTRRALLRRGLARSAFREADWFAPLAAALEEIWEEILEEPAETLARFDPPLTPELRAALAEGFPGAPLPAPDEAAQTLRSAAE